MEGKLSSFFNKLISAPKEFADKISRQREFSAALDASLSDSSLTKAEMKSLKDFCEKHGIDINEVLLKSRKKIDSFIRKMLADISDDGIVTKQEKTNIESACQFLNPSQAVISEVSETISRIKEIEKIRSGKVIGIKTGAIVAKSGEIVWCCFEGVFLMREKGDEITAYEGDLFVTSNRVIFNSFVNPVEVPLSHILGYDGDIASLCISAKTKKASCEFEVHNGDFLEAYLEQAINRFHHKLDLKATTGRTRSIPQSVKLSVWERDQGECVKCGGSQYLEYDHIIPFSKGGSNSEKNIQLLCRACNLKKGGRI